MTTKVPQKPEESGGVFSRLIKSAPPRSSGINERALQLEETRKQYEADLSLIFNSIEAENKQISKLIQEKRQLAKGIMPYLDYERWRKHVMDRFKKVAIKKD